MWYYLRKNRDAGDGERMTNFEWPKYKVNMMGVVSNL